MIEALASPEDVRRFWTERAHRAETFPLDYRRTLRPQMETSTHVVETIDFAVPGGRTLHGWLAYPPGARRRPGFVWLPPYGRESKLPDAYGTREEMVSLSFNFHGEAAFHQERYVTDRGYFADGIADAETWIFGQMLEDAIIATRVLQAQIEADEDRLGAMGMSQGGGMSIWLGAWCPIIKAVCADMPFLSDIGQTLTNTVYRYPLKEISDFMETIPLGRERVLSTVSLYDTVAQAAFCTKPTQVSAGLKDPACRPDTVRKAYEALPGKKRLIEYDWGHDWHPEMVSRNLEWLRENLS